MTKRRIHCANSLRVVLSSILLIGLVGRQRSGSAEEIVLRDGERHRGAFRLNHFGIELTPQDRVFWSAVSSLKNDDGTVVFEGSAKTPVDSEVVSRDSGEIHGQSYSLASIGVTLLLPKSKTLRTKLRGSSPRRTEFSARSPNLSAFTLLTVEDHRGNPPIHLGTFRFAVVLGFTGVSSEELLSRIAKGILQNEVEGWLPSRVKRNQRNGRYRSKNIATGDHTFATWNWREKSRDPSWDREVSVLRSGNTLFLFLSQTKGTASVRKSIQARFHEIVKSLGFNESYAALSKVSARIRNTLTGGIPEEGVRSAHTLVERSTEGQASTTAVSIQAHSTLNECFDRIHILEEALANAVRERDEHSKELVAHYKKTRTSRDSKRTKATYSEHLEISRKKNAKLRQLEEVRDAYVLAGRKISSRIEDPETLKTTAKELAVRLSKRESSSLRSSILRSVDGPVIPELAQPLKNHAATTDHREVRLAALECLQRGSERTTWIHTATQCLRDADPFVRRATIGLLASDGSVEAIDRLVAHLPKESGVPRRELLDHLVYWSGRPLSDSPTDWSSWWKGARVEWQPSPHQPGTSSAPRGDIHFFGLRLDTERVVFLVEHSIGLRFGKIHYPAPDSSSAPNRKVIEVVREELARAIDGLGKRATFELIFFGVRTNSFSNQLALATNAKRTQAKKWIGDQNPVGQANLSEALVLALSYSTPNEKAKETAIADTIVLVTNSSPAFGQIPNDQDLLSEVQRIRRGGAVVIHAIHLGDESTSTLPRELAEQTGGQFIHVR